VSISVGIAQNTGRNAMAMQITLNSKTDITFELGRLMRHTNPVAAIKSGPQRASVFRDFCRNPIR
jgi:hypothetical protein